MLFKAFLLTLSIAYAGCQVSNPPCSPTVSDACTCRSTYATCSWWGDPHTLTFDGTYHHFQGITRGRYKYVTPCTNNFQLVPFQIIAVHRPCPIERVQCTWYLDVRLYDITGKHLRTLAIYNGGIRDSVLGGNIPANFPIYYTFSSYYKLVVSGTTRELYFYTGRLCSGKYDFKITDNTYMTRVTIELNEYYEYLVCGLCGFYSNNAADDFVRGDGNCGQSSTNLPYGMRDYTTATWDLLNEFGDSWTDGDRRRLNENNEPPIYNPDLIQQAENKILNLFPAPASPPILPRSSIKIGDEDTFLEKCAEEAAQVCPNLDDDCIKGCCQPICEGDVICPDPDVVRVFVETYIPYPERTPPEDQVDGDDDPVDEWVPDF